MMIILSITNIFETLPIFPENKDNVFKAISGKMIPLQNAVSE